MDRFVLHAEIMSWLWGALWIVLILVTIPETVIGWSSRIRRWLGKRILRLVSEKEWNRIKDDFEDI